MVRALNTALLAHRNNPVQKTSSPRRGRAHCGDAQRMCAAESNLADPAKLARDDELLRGENEALRDQIDWFKRKHFGPGKRAELKGHDLVIAKAIVDWRCR